MAKANQDHIPAFGRLLRFWRMTTELSQEELSARVGASARHLSFLENGKSNPGRQMVIDLAQVFELAHRDTNNMLVAAGFQPNNTTDDSESEQKFLEKSLKLTILYNLKTSLYSLIHFVVSGILLNFILATLRPSNVLYSDSFAVGIKRDGL